MFRTLAQPTEDAKAELPNTSGWIKGNNVSNAAQTSTIY